MRISFCLVDVILSLAAFFVFLSCHRQGADTWSAVMVAIPSKIEPRDAIDNTVSYILAQTHEPIFRYADNNTFRSNILESWGRNAEFTSFRLCPKKDLVFDQTHPFRPEDLSGALEHLRQIRSDVRIKNDGSCVELAFASPYRGIFQVLTSLEFAPSIHESSPLVPVGLGPFFIRKFDSNLLELERKVGVAGAYNHIKIVSLDSLSQGEEDVQDYNMIPTEKLPKWIYERYQQYSVSLLKVYVLGINVKDRDVRKRIYNCVDIGRLRDIFFEKDVKLDVGSIFPIGIEGAVPQKVSQDCNKFWPKERTGRTPVFFNWKPELKTKLDDFFGDVAKKSGIKISVRNISPNDLLEIFMKHPDQYDLAIFVLDTFNEEYLPFFESLLDPYKRLISIEMPKLKGQFLRLRNSSDKQERVSLATSLNSSILNEFVVLPLTQQNRMFYFPRNVKGVSIGSNFMGFVEVGDLRL